MSEQTTSPDFTRSQKAGLLAFVVLCGVPALEMNGFGFGIPFSLATGLACAVVGGGVGGLLLCPRPALAGLLGGLLAGPLGLLAVYYDTQHRHSVSNVELAVVQGLGCLPGVVLGFLLRKALPGSPPADGREAQPPVTAGTSAGR